MVAEAIGVSTFLTRPVTRRIELTGFWIAHLTICFETSSPDAASTAWMVCPCSRRVKKPSLALCDLVFSMRA